MVARNCGLYLHMHAHPKPVHVCLAFLLQEHLGASPYRITTFFEEMPVQYGEGRGTLPETAGLIPAHVRLGWGMALPALLQRC